MCVAETTVVSLSDKIKFKTGDVIQLKDSEYSVTIGFDKGSKCAVPGFNCGSGYQPPRPTFSIQCGKINPCPYVALIFPNDSTTGLLSIENIKSCETHDTEICFREFANLFKKDVGCMNISNPDGRYYCLKNFENSKLIENKKLCDELSPSVYALKWNCFYEYAIRYKDQNFCDKYSAKESSGRNRCFLKMAEILKDKSLCSKINKNSEDSYLEQCQKNVK